MRRELRTAQADLGLPDDVIPSKSQLIGIRRWDLVRAVWRAGGFRKVAAGLAAERGVATKASIWRNEHLWLQFLLLRYPSSAHLPFT